MNESKQFKIEVEGFPAEIIEVTEPGHAGYREAAWDKYKSKHFRNADGERIHVITKPKIEEVDGVSLDPVGLD